jgi:preprotein translocase subunit YajC
MKALVLNYYKNTVLAKNSTEAIDFINSLQGITANKFTVDTLENYFSVDNSHIKSIWKTGKAFEIATTGCGMSRIFAYKPQANTLEKHNEILAEQKKKKEAEEAEKRNQREQEHLEMMYELMKGWYIVTVTGLAFKLRGNDGKVTKSVKVLADNRMEAYEKAVKHLEENPPKNVMNFYSFESSKSALIEYIGIWTDKAEIEFY